MSVDDGRVISNFVVQALQNKPISVYGSGSNVRSFCFVDDLINGLFSLFSYKEFIGPVNLGNPSSTTIINLAREIVELTSSESIIEFHELPPDDPKLRTPDVSKAAHYLGWKPQISRLEGLQKTIGYFKEIC
jgi:UDP-glucuronate decarboxylase